jgi:hypothetical protein
MVIQDSIYFIKILINKNINYIIIILINIELY